MKSSMGKYELRIDIDGSSFVRMQAPTFELLTEKYGAWERAQKLEEPIDTTLKCQYCDVANSEDNQVEWKTNGDEGMEVCESCFDHMFN